MIYKHTPRIVFGFGALMWLSLARHGGTWFEHFVALFAMVTGVVLHRRPGPWPTRPAPPRWVVQAGVVAVPVAAAAVSLAVQ